MKLYSNIIGEGQPLVILHGLFGSSDNWQTLGRRFAQDFEVHLVDQRNHGQSGHSAEMSYDLMAADLEQYMEENFLRNVILAGHSMGGKTAMRFAQRYPHYLQKIIIADIAPREYDRTHDEVWEGLLAVDVDAIERRSQAHESLAQHIEEEGVRQFLLKNLHWKEKGRLAWRMNLMVLADKMKEITANTEGEMVELPALFVRGELSPYISDADISVIKKQFPNSEVATMLGVGHWVHAENPEEFYKLVMEFAKKE